MQCRTVLPGTECTFAGKDGCTYHKGECQPIVEECIGCDKIVDSVNGKVCSAYPEPSKKWQGGICNAATHVKVEVQSEVAKVNPLKASKKAAGSKKK
jgi:hypothetical protein